MVMLHNNSKYCMPNITEIGQHLQKLQSHEKCGLFWNTVYNDNNNNNTFGFKYWHQHQRTTSGKWDAYSNYYNNSFTTICPGLPGWIATRRINHSGFCWSRDDEVAVASPEPYASYLHFAAEDNYSNISSVRFLWAGCSSWNPTNSVKALKARHGYKSYKKHRTV